MIKQIKQYACLECGRIHSSKPVKERYDKIGSCGFHDHSFHGYITYRICPECGHKENINMTRDK